jgi:alkylhydroperoxidase family enzyme
VIRPSAPRIAPRTELTDELRALAGAMPGGQVSNLGATLAWHPELLRVFGGIGRWMLEGERVPLRQRVIVALRVGWRTRALYEFAQNQRRAPRAGLTPADVRRLASDEPGAGFSGADALVVQLVDELCSGDAVGESTWKRVAGHWDPPALLELVMLIGFYRMLAGVLNAAGIQLEPGVPGWPADAAQEETP